MINGIVDTQNIQVSNKKFKINKERRIVKGNEKFKVINSSRPRKCPRCNSEKTVIKSPYKQGKWECSEAKGGCSFEW